MNNNKNDHSNFNITKPLGIDFNNFNPSTTSDDINYFNDIPIIQELATPHKNIKDILTKRKNTLKMLAGLWVKGNLTETIQALSLTKDLGVANDFFNYAFMKDGMNKDYLKLDHSVTLLPLVLGLVKSKYESNFRIGIKMVCMLFDMYSNSILMVRRKVGASTEDNLLKYEQLIAFFEQIIRCETIKKRNLEADKNLKSLLQEMEDFINQCNKNY